MSAKVPVLVGLVLIVAVGVFVYFQTRRTQPQTSFTASSTPQEAIQADTNQSPDTSSVLPTVQVEATTTIQ